ncbi:MAG: recombinase family protein [Thermoplasmata archaeon]
MPARAALYVRVSTEDQAREGFSLEAQIEKLRSYCTAREWTVSGEYVDDGVSGRTLRRPAYAMMMEERENWDTILVLKMDRIHRNSRNFMEMMDRLRGWGKEFTSMQESLDTGTAMGRFVMDIIQRIAQLESEQIGERVYMGMQQKAKAQRGSLGAPAPFGYRSVGGDLIVQEPQATQVRDVFRRALQREPMAWIAERLNRTGARTNRGRTWSVWSVRYILRNPVYAGYTRWDKVVRQGEHDPLVSKEDFVGVLEGFLLRARREAERQDIKTLIDTILSEDELSNLLMSEGVAEHAV